MRSALIVVVLSVGAVGGAQVRPSPGPPPLVRPKASPLATVTPGTYIDRATLAATTTFIGRVLIASSNTAGTVLEEPTNTPNHGNRYALAQMVLKEPEFLARRVSPMIAAAIPVNSTDHDNDPATPPIIDTTWTDAQIQNLIDTRWNLLANAFVPVGTTPAMLPPALPPAPAPAVKR